MYAPMSAQTPTVPVAAMFVRQLRNAAIKYA